MAKYTQETLERALDLVRSGRMSQLAASKSFGIPQSTLNDKILGKTPLKKKKKTVLSDEEEEKLALWIIEMSRRGFGRSKEHVKDDVKILLDKRGAETVFRDNRPGKDWMAAFLSRHKEISERMSQALGKERTMVSKESLQKWFEDLNRYVNSVDPTLFLQPHRIFNADESGFSICPKTKKVLAPDETKHVNQMASSSRTQITVLACSSAAGEYLPPLLIFPYQRKPRFNPLEGFERAFFQRNKNGCISTEVFHTWIRDVFIPAVEEKPKPVLLYVDGHTSHVTSIETCELCQDKGVLLYCLRPHSSHIKLPLDEAYFGVLKRAWCEEVRKYMFVTGEVVTLPTFSRVLSEAWKVAARPEIAFSVFTRYGLFPFDPSVAVNSEKTKAAESFIIPSDHPQKTPESFSEKLSVFEELVKMGSETNLKNIERIRKGYNVADVDFSRWKDLVLAMFGTPISSGSEPPISQSPQNERTTPALQREYMASRSSIELMASRFEPSTSGIESTALQRFESLTSSIEPLTSRGNHISKGSSSTSIKQVLLFPTIPKKTPHINKKDSCRTMALSSDESINILKSKEKKKELEDAKERRKLNKEEKKKNKQETEKEKKRQRQREKEPVRERKEKIKGETKKEKERQKEIEKERKRKERKEKKSQKGKGPSKKRIRLDVSDDDDDFTYDDDNDDNVYMEDMEVEVQEIVLGICRGCHGKKEHTEWVECKICDGWWHVSCVKDESVKMKSLEELKNFDFGCELCIGKD